MVLIFLGDVTAYSETQLLRTLKGNEKGTY